MTSAVNEALQGFLLRGREGCMDFCHCLQLSQHDYTKYIGNIGTQSENTHKKTGGDNFFDLAWCYRSQFHEQAIADEVNLTLISSFNRFSVQHASLIIHYLFIMRVVNYEATSGWKSCNGPVKYIIKLLPRLNFFFFFIIYLLVRSLRKIRFYIKINCWKEISQRVHNRRM